MQIWKGLAKRNLGASGGEQLCVLVLSTGIAGDGVRILTLTTLSSHKELNEDTCTLLHEIAKLELYQTLQESLSVICESHLCLY